MELLRPISCIDFETTGTNPETDQICSFAITQILPTWETRTYSRLVKPGIEIPPESTAIHGITNGHVVNAGNWGYWAPKVIQTLDNNDILTYNGKKFDIPLFFNECKRFGIEWDYTQYNFLDAYQLMAKMEKRTLEKMFLFYMGFPMEGAHNAEADTNATADIFKEQIRRYTDVPKTVGELALWLNDNKPMADLSGKFSYNEKNEAIFSFGKYKDKTIETVKVVDPNYFTWFNNADFPNDSKLFLSNLLNNKK